MKAILKHDEIIAISERGVEIGNPPPGVGLERLRFNGNAIIDLANLNSMWVTEDFPKAYKLHCLKINGSQFVSMTYGDRKNLITDNGTIRIKTSQEILSENQASGNDISDNQNLKLELQDLLADLTYSRIDSHIDNVFGSLTEPQKVSMKRLYKVVLFLAKRNR